MSAEATFRFIAMVRLTAPSLVFVLGVVFLGATATAAELRLDPAHASGTGVVFEGRIELGDFERFKNFVIGSGHVTEMFLASPGGNLAEAVKIGILVRLLKLSTVVPSKQLTHYDRALAVTRHGLKDSKDYACTSACFFIFVAGTYRSTDDHGPAILGIHSPLLPNDLTKSAPSQVDAAIDRTRKAIEGYFKVMDVPAKYTEEINSVPRNRIRWIRQDEFQSDFAGFIPELRPLVKTKCENRSDENRRNNAKQNDQIHADEHCEAEMRDELAARALKDALKAPGYDPQSIFKIVPHPN